MRSVTPPTLSISDGRPFSNPSAMPCITYLATPFDHFDGLCSSKPFLPVNQLLILSTTPETLLLSHATLSAMPSHKPMSKFLPTSFICFGMLRNQSSAVCAAFGIVSVKNVLIAATAPEMVSLIFSHAEMTAFRKSSFVFHRTTIAATNAPTTAITAPMGFAVKAAFKAICPFVIAACASCASVIFPVSNATIVSPTVIVPFNAACASVVSFRPIVKREIDTCAFWNPCTRC